MNNLSSIIFGLILTCLLTATVPASDSGKGGDDFRKTALEYEQQAGKFKKKGLSEIAGIYSRMVEIKRHAASLADKDRWDDIDWTEYEKLDEKLIKLLSNKE